MSNIFRELPIFGTFTLLLAIKYELGAPVVQSQYRNHDDYKGKTIGYGMIGI